MCYRDGLFSAESGKWTRCHFDDFMIGQRAAEMILRLTNGDEVEKEVIDEYEVILKGSTK